MTDESTAGRRGPAPTLPHVGPSPGIEDRLIDALAVVWHRPALLGLSLVLGAAGGFLRAAYLVGPLEPVPIGVAVVAGTVALTAVVAICRSVDVDEASGRSTVGRLVKEYVVAVALLAITLALATGAFVGTVLALQILAPPAVVLPTTLVIGTALAVHVTQVVPVIAVDRHGPITGSVVAWHAAHGHRIQQLVLLVGLVLPSAFLSGYQTNLYGPSFTVAAGLAGVLGGITLVAFARMYVEGSRDV